ncbi:18128_t:CDS:2, partial [Acaulospora morrowiae]
CENEKCPIQCPILECKRMCQSDDHFHEYSENQVINHFCGKEHQCREICEGSGICKILSEPQKREEICQGNLDKPATSAKYIQLGERLMCCKKIPPNKFRHEGAHTHSQDNNVVHFCDAKCQFCEYYVGSYSPTYGVFNL